MYESHVELRAAATNHQHEHTRDGQPWLGRRAPHLVSENERSALNMASSLCAADKSQDGAGHGECVCTRSERRTAARSCPAASRRARTLVSSGRGTRHAARSSTGPAARTRDKGVAAHPRR
jgi:hypothetical protein